MKIIFPGRIFSSERKTGNYKNYSLKIKKQVYTSVFNGSVN
jgi:hypothetical protein